MTYQENATFYTDVISSDDFSFQDSLPHNFLFQNEENASFSDEFKKEFSNDVLLKIDSLQVKSQKSISITNDVLNQIVPNQVDIYKFINPEKKSKTVNLSAELTHDVVDKNASENKNNILESVFSVENLTETSQNLPENVEIKIGKATDVFHTSEDINEIHKQSIENRTKDFIKLTLLKQDGEESYSSINSLDNEFKAVKNSIESAIFVDEFEQIISKLRLQLPLIKENIDNLDYLLQFKLSIHLIKVLSEMMQAVHLKEFSNTVLEFLDDLVDGKSTITPEIVEHFYHVVDYYNYYNDSIK
ncbi:MAG: hypothetical protein OQL19_12775 [Gammaproteobacteria bacterium]|nr:hypothetical protein [Gammaproteobacteria bacterium]